MTLTDEMLREWVANIVRQVVDQAEHFADLARPSDRRLYVDAILQQALDRLAELVQKETELVFTHQATGEVAVLGRDAVERVVDALLAARPGVLN